MDNLRVNGHNCVMQKGHKETFLLLYCTGVFLCFWGVLTRLDKGHLQITGVVASFASTTALKN